MSKKGLREEMCFNDCFLFSKKQTKRYWNHQKTNYSSAKSGKRERLSFVKKQAINKHRNNKREDIKETEPYSKQNAIKILIVTNTNQVSSKHSFFPPHCIIA